LLKNLERDTEKTRNSTPEWDLNIVLNALMKSPFEPIHTAELKFVTFKTVFLLALATGKRRSELHALRHDFRHKEDWSLITLFPDPAFVSKTALANSGACVVNSVNIKALTPLLSDDMEERTLCPVRAFRFYLDRTKDIREGKKKLFISFKPGHKTEIALNTVSGWIKKTIITAYNASSNNCANLKIKAHDVRGVAASLAFFNGTSLSDIMQACTWKSNTTFVSFYLKDLTMLQNNKFVLGPGQHDN
jgi:hypothetical protein